MSDDLWYCRFEYWSTTDIIVDALTKVILVNVWDLNKSPSEMVIVPVLVIPLIQHYTVSNTIDGTR